MRMKSMSSLKEKKRYIVFKIHSERKLDFFNIKDAMWNSLSNWLGEKNLAAADVWIIKNMWSQQNQTGYLKCNHNYVDSVITALALIHQMGDEKVIFQVIKISGTIKSAKK